jgi:hypothetical protein
MRVAILFFACVGCSNSSPSGLDASSDAAVEACTAPASDASFTCDVSSLSESAKTCGHWSGLPTLLDGGGESCKAALEWSGGGGGGSCDYDWYKSGPPDLCSLPTSEDGGGPFTWLHPTCDAGCP